MISVGVADMLTSSRVDVRQGSAQDDESDSVVNSKAGSCLFVRVDGSVLVSASGGTVEVNKRLVPTPFPLSPFSVLLSSFFFLFRDDVSSQCDKRPT